MGVDTHLLKYYNDYFTDVARGYVPGAKPIYGYGEVTTEGAVNTYSVLWPNGPYGIPVPQGEAFEVFSSSANDTTGGTGIRSIHVHYLDGNNDEQDVIVPLSGLTPVSSLSLPTPINDCTFIQCTHLAEIGSLGAAAGTITIRRIGGDNQTFSLIAAGDVRCSSSMRRVPRGYRFLVNLGIGSSSSSTAGANSTIRIAVNAIADHVYVDPLVFVPIVGLGFRDNSFGSVLPGLEAVPEGIIVGMVYKTSLSATLTSTWFGVQEKV